MVAFTLNNIYEYLPLWLLVMPVPGQPTDAAVRDSDLAVTCGQEFAVFDRDLPSGRTLNVVPWVLDGDLQVAGTVEMPGTQPHAWAIHGELVIVRTWNDLYVYRVDAAFQPQLQYSVQIDDVRPSSGGTVAISLTGSVVRAYGVESMVVLDLNSCAERCEGTVQAAAPPPRQATAPQRCGVHRGDLLFALTIADTPGREAIYHDLFLTRRRTDPTGRLLSEAFVPESVLYLGTRIETTR